MQIDAQLESCGWVVQDYKYAAVAAAKGVAVREVGKLYRWLQVSSA